MSSNRFESIADLIEGEARAKEKPTDEDLIEALNSLDWDSAKNQSEEADEPVSTIDFASGTVTISTTTTGNGSGFSMNDLSSMYAQTESPAVLRELVRAYDGDGNRLSFNGSSSTFSISPTPAPALIRGQQIWQSGRGSTNRSDPSTILTYVVPVSKNLYLQSYHVQALTQTNIDALITLRVNSGSIDRMRCSGIDVQTRSFGDGIMIAESGGSISLEIAPRSTVTTEWSVSFLGFLVDA